VEEIRREFTSILRSTGAQYKKLTVKEGTGGEGIYDTHIEPNGIVSLTYNPFIVRCQSKETLIACLRHEACHILTIPMSNVPVPAVQPEMVSFLANQTSAYDEFLAHQEFLKRWPNDRALSAFKEAELINFAIILLTLRRNMSAQMLENPLEPLNTLSVIFQDATYFMIAREDAMRNWGKQYGANAIVGFIDFWYRDFKTISSWPVDRDRTIDLVQLSATLSISVDPALMVQSDLITFDASSAETYTSFMRKRKTAEEQQLISSWIARLQ
jgi:hypothetical protein